ncbi:MAG TPA: serine/threonine-protein kinase, partial [Gemmataceae bacterium]|nr:serine/threonine-protein kinase [Gemmataceae bacterium]
MPAPRECLTDAELVALHLGDLPEAELARAAAHLETCRRCEEAAGALDGLSDPTLAAYRQSALAGPVPDAEALPESVGDYEILGEVGRGGMGVVYKARHRRLGRVVALKMLLGGYFADRAQRQRFRTEAEAVARLQHPGIVQLFEVGEHDVGAGPPRPYFTLEYVEGGSLDRRLAGRPLPPPQAAAWLDQLARAVHYAHERGIIHRDLKPSNVLLTDDGRPKVCDFGVAKLLTGSDCQTASGMILGTAEYMAPEQAEGKGTPGPASDVYALGVILYEMLAGRPPFKGPTPLDTLAQHRTQEPVPVRRLQPSVSRDLETICLKCLEKEPGRRYPLALELAEDLRRFLDQRPVKARGVSAAGRLGRWARRNRGVAAALGVIALLLIGAAVASSLAALRFERLADEADRRGAAERRQRYRANMAATAMALQVSNTGAARRALAAAPEEYRGWEWLHFNSHLLDGARAVLRMPGARDAATFRPGGATRPALAFSPDGKRIAAASLERGTVVWDTATGREAAVLPGQGHDVRDMAFGPDGHLLAWS